MCTLFPVEQSQTRALASSPMEAAVRPSGLTETVCTRPLCPCSSLLGPAAKSHTRAVESWDPVTANLQGAQLKLDGCQCGLCKVVRIAHAGRKSNLAAGLLLLGSAHGSAAIRLAAGKQSWKEVPCI